MKRHIRAVPTLVLAFVLLAGAAPGTFTFPDTPAGHRAAGYIEAFNSGREDAVRAFIEANVAQASLAQRPVAERLAIYREMRDEHGTLTPVRLLEAGDDRIRVLAHTGHGADLDITFLLEPTAPHMLMGLRVEQGEPEDEAAAAAPATPLSDDQAVQAWSAHLDSLARADAFSGAVLVAKGDAIFFRAAYGQASRADRIANRADTRFNLGSINKIFTKLAIAQLVEQGKVKLDDTIDHYLPGYPKAAASKVTVRQLLDHRGGVGDIFGDAYDRADKTRLRRVADWIPLFRDQPLAFELGTRQQYSNGGYVLLGAIVEKASGEDYYDYVRRHIYEPLGMKASGHFASDEHLENLASGYTRQRLPGVVPEASGWADNRPTRPMRGSPAGGGYSTLDDLLAFTKALRAGRLLRAGTRDFADLVPGPNGEVGLGIGGGAPGINAAVEVSGPYTIIVLANLDPPAAERAAAKLRRGLPGAGDGRQRVRVGGGAHGGARLGGEGAGARAPGPSPEGGPGMVMEMAGPRDALPERSLIPVAGADVEMLFSDHLPVVSVMVNGQGPFRFAIDTGLAGSARLDSALVARLGLQKVGETLSGDPSGRNARRTDLVRVESIALGAARFEGVVVSVRSSHERRLGGAIDGILGFRLFRECLFTLDYPAHRVRIERGDLPPANGKDVIACEIRHGVPSVRLQVDSLWMDADVDAGAMGGFTLPARVAEKLALASAPRVVGRARTVGNEFEITAAELKGSVRLGGIEFAGATIGFQPVFPMANVGSRVLRDFRVTFDQKNGRMRLVRGA